MAQNEEIILEVKFTDDNTAKRMAEIQNQLIALNKTYSDTKKAVKDNGEVTEEQAKRMAENRAQVKSLTNEMKFYEKQIEAEAKQNKMANDSLNAKRTNLRKMIAEYDALSGAQRNNAEVGGKMRAEINKLTDEIKQIEEGTQRYQRNVGNYANSITKALASQVPVIGKVSGAMDMLKTSTGWIGIVIQGAVMLFSALSMAFKRTEGNGDKLSGGLAKMKGLFVMMQQALEPLVKGLVDGFVVALDKALQAIGWLGEKLVSFLRAIKADGMADSLEAFAQRTRETAEATSELAVAEEQLHRKQREARKTMLEYQRQAEELRQTRDDATKSAEEQEEANIKLLALLQEQKRVEGGIQQEAIRVAKMRIQLNGETTENLDALTDAETEYADVIERITGQSSEAIKWQNDRLAVLKEEILVIDELLKKTLDVNNATTAYKPPKPQFDTDEDDEEIIDEAKRLQELNNIRLQYEQLGFDERLKLQQENLDIEHARRVASGEDAVVTEAWYQAEQTRIVKENAEARKQYALDVAQSSMAGASSMISSLKELAEVSGASAQYQKALALAEVALNTGQAISAGIASAMATPFPANIGAILTTISAVISGIAQAKSAIKSANIPTAKFAQGGIVTGEGTATSDSIPAMLSNGESVMTARATSTYSPILSAMNQSVGGAPIGDSTKTKGTQQLMEQFADVIEQIQIQVAVTDINDGQARVAKIVDNSNF